MRQNYGYFQDNQMSWVERSKLIGRSYLSYQAQWSIPYMAIIWFALDHTIHGYYFVLPRIIPYMVILWAAMEMV